MTEIWSLLYGILTVLILWDITRACSIIVGINLPEYYNYVYPLRAIYKVLLFILAILMAIALKRYTDKMRA